MIKLLHSSGSYCVTVLVNIQSMMLKSEFSLKYWALLDSFLTNKRQRALSVRELTFWVWVITALTLLMRNLNEHKVRKSYLGFVVWLFVNSCVKSWRCIRSVSPIPSSCLLFAVFPSLLCVFPAADLLPEEPPPNPCNGVITTNQCDDSAWLALS